jgi:hypothetical protein
LGAPDLLIAFIKGKYQSIGYKNIRTREREEERERK